MDRKQRENVYLSHWKRIQATKLSLKKDKINTKRTELIMEQVNLP
jgi:hypothetical protein